MIHLQNLNHQVAIACVSATNGATITSKTIDALGYDYMSLCVFATTSDAVSDKPATLKLQDSDTTDASNFADITAFVGGGTGGFTIPSADTATGTPAYADLAVDLRYRKRYLRLLVSPLTTQTYGAHAVLGRAEKVPVSTTDRNVRVAVIG